MNQIVKNWLNRTSLESISNRTGISDWLKFCASLEKLQVPVVASSLDDESDDNLTTSVSLEALEDESLDLLVRLLRTQLKDPSSLKVC